MSYEEWAGRSIGFSALSGSIYLAEILTESACVEVLPEDIYHIEDSYRAILKFESCDLYCYLPNPDDFASKGVCFRFDGMQGDAALDVDPSPDSRTVDYQRSAMMEMFHSRPREC